ncbi:MULTISPECIES: hypothetical protein [Tatumella]|nr:MULTISPECIES: hypothetical protein [Tatumella]
MILFINIAGDSKKRTGNGEAGKRKIATKNEQFSGERRNDGAL